MSSIQFFFVCGGATVSDGFAAAHDGSAVLTGATNDLSCEEVYRRAVAEVP